MGAALRVTSRREHGNPCDEWVVTGPKGSPTEAMVYALFDDAGQAHAYAATEGRGEAALEALCLPRPPEPSAEVLAMLDLIAEDFAQGDGNELPDHLTHCPGLVGEIVDFICDTARYPQRSLALGVALCLVGTAIGRKVAGPTLSGTHLYALALAPTGGGKAHALKMGPRIMSAAGMVGQIGPGSFISQSAVISTVARKPQLVCYIDEFGNWLAKINAKNASSHERGISGILRELWGKSFDTYSPPAWADSNVSASNLKPVHSPSLSIYGASVPEEFYAALQGADVFNGFLNRFLIFSTDETPEEVEPETDEFDVPDAIAATLKDLVALGGPLYGGSSHNEEASAPYLRVPWSCPEAQALYVAFKRAIAADTLNGKLLARSAEIAVRLATIRAVGIDQNAAKVTPEDMAWGIEIARASAERMIRDAADHMVESPYQAMSKQVARLIREATSRQGGMTRSELTKAIDGKWPPQTTDQILKSLVEGEQVEAMTVKRDGPGRSPVTLVWAGL